MVKFFFKKDKDGNFDLWEITDLGIKWGRIFLTHHGRWIYKLHIRQPSIGICNTSEKAKKILFDQLKEYGYQ